MDERTLRRLRRLDRVLRPGAAAQRSQAHVAAQGNDRTDELRRSLDHQASELAGLRAEVAALAIQVGALVTYAGATASETARAAAAAETTAVATQRLQPALERVAQATEAVRARVAPLDVRNERYDEWTAEIIRRTLAGTDDTGIDVGAHEGLILRHVVAAAPGGHHHAFEPLPEHAAGLRRDFPGVEVHEIALADAAGEAEFHHVTTNPQFSGLQLRSFAASNEVTPITVRAARLDDVIAPEVPVRLLKIDVEGGELGVLRGATRTLGQHRPVTVFEFGLSGAGMYLTRPNDVFELFAGAGMAISLLDDHLAGRSPLTGQAFAEQYRTGANYYFVAHPVSGAARPDQ